MMTYSATIKPFLLSDTLHHSRLFCIANMVVAHGGRQTNSSALYAEKLSGISLGQWDICCTNIYHKRFPCLSVI